MAAFVTKAFLASPVLFATCLLFYFHLLALALHRGFREWFMNVFLPLSPVGQRRLLQLDGVRGFMALIVVVTHYKVLGLTGELSAHNNLAVDVFAALSGYVLYGPLLRGSLSESQIRHFIVRRLCRIIPLYWFCLAMLIAGVCLATGPKFTVLNTSTFISNFLMLDIFHHGIQFHWPAVTLYPEMMYSLLLPVAIIVIRKRPLLGNLIIYGVLMYFSGSSGEYLKYFRFFWLGMLVFDLRQFLAEHLFVVHIQERAWLRETICLLAFAAGVAAYFSPLDLIYTGLFFYLPQKYYGLLGPGPWLNTDIAIFLMMLVWCSSNAISRLWSFPVLVFLGTISYSIYLVHIPLGVLFHGVIRPDGWYFSVAAPYPSGSALEFWLIYLPAVLFVSAVTYVVVERPFIALGRRLTLGTDARSLKSRHLETALPLADTKV